MKKKLNKKELWHLYLGLNLVTIFNFYRYLGVFTTAIIFLLGWNFFAKFAGNLVAKKFNVF